MDCREAENLIGAYVDGELDLRSALTIETHVKACASCARALESHQTLSRSLRSAKLAYAAPENLRRRILLATAPPAPNPLSAWFTWRPTAMAVSFAAFALVLSTGALQWRSIRAENLLADEVIGGHVRSLQAAHLMDVPSTDKHTVKPWFAGKLDFSPPVEDLAAEGFPLVGGRLDYLQGQPVAALVYGRAKHSINLFILPASGEAAERSRTARGFHSVHWAKGGMSYWAVSDLNAEELSHFASLLRARE